MESNHLCRACLRVTASPIAVLATHLGGPAGTRTQNIFTLGYDSLGKGIEDSSSYRPTYSYYDDPHPIPEAYLSILAPTHTAHIDGGPHSQSKPFANTPHLVCHQHHV